MSLDAGKVLKRSVLCPHCNEHYLFALRAIANNPDLKCHGCGGNIRIRDSTHEELIRNVRNTLAAIDAIQIAPSFISAGHTVQWRAPENRDSHRLHLR